VERNGALDTSVLLKSLNAIEEIWKWVSDGEETISPSTEEGSDSGEDLMTISIQALSETEGDQNHRIEGHLNGKEVFMLIDLGSSHNFINDQLVELISPGILCLS
jgi:uncharacterized protein YtpQ (UPF0354 family)